jgi:hypothetical protein
VISKIPGNVPKIKKSVKKPKIKKIVNYNLKELKGERQNKDIPLSLLSFFSYNFFYFLFKMLSLEIDYL